MLKTSLMKMRLKEMGKSLVDVSSATGISYGMVTQVFNGHQKNPTSKTILPICKFLGMPFETLWFEEDSDAIVDESPNYWPEDLKLAPDEYLTIGSDGVKEIRKLTPELKAYIDFLEQRDKKK